MSRYAAAHASPEGPGDSRPTALQVVKDEGMEGKLEGKVIVITGTSSGIALLAASTPGSPSRVVNVSSAAHRRNGINASDNYNFEKGGYDPWVAYAQSKTANIYMANEIERRYGSLGLHATSVHPGGILTGLSKHIPEAEVAAMLEDKALVRSSKSPEQGAATTVLAAIGKEWENKGGKYLADCAEAKRENDDGNIVRANYTSHTYDMESEGRLWKDSLRMVGLADD
ncbi:dehydrogenase/reductase SDR family member on chromosome X [Aspergillus udagawae]|nr:dehydrogenase/reductase SDR family member on chromosome X [Aspergillus udagawae]